jgi:hypothetical protein
VPLIRESLPRKNDQKEKAASSRQMSIMNGRPMNRANVLVMCWNQLPTRVSARKLLNQNALLCGGLQQLFAILAPPGALP